MRIRTDQFSRTLQQFVFRNFLFWKKEREQEEETVCVMYDWLDPSLRRRRRRPPSGDGGVGVGLRLCVWTCDTERGSPCWPRAASPGAESAQTLRAGSRGRQQGAVKLRSRTVGSDAGCYDRAPSSSSSSSSPPPPPSPSHHHPICHSSSLSLSLHLLLFLLLLVSASSLHWMAGHGVTNQEHSSPMRWHERPTLRSSFTILRTASSRPRPRWSNRQSCCSGRRCSMQNT